MAAEDAGGAVVLGLVGADRDGAGFVPLPGVEDAPVADRVDEPPDELPS